MQTAGRPGLQRCGRTGEGPTTGRDGRRVRPPTAAVTCLQRTQTDRGGILRDMRSAHVRTMLLQRPAFGSHDGGCRRCCQKEKGIYSAFNSLRFGVFVQFGNCVLKSLYTIDTAFKALNFSKTGIRQISHSIVWFIYIHAFVSKQFFDKGGYC